MNLETLFSKQHRNDFATHVVALCRMAWASPLKILFVAFFIFQLALGHHGGDNVQSRLAHLASLVERGSSRIDPYAEVWTTDWARTPDGAYYSNKAPGPVFLALPFYWAFDTLSTWDLEGETQKIQRREKLGNPFMGLASLLLQIIPYALLGLYFLGRLIRSQYSFASQTWWTLAYLFGTTASIFLNTFFGHGIAVVFVLGMILGMMEKKWALVGFCFGWALLSDYAVGMFFPVLLGFMLLQKLRLKEWGAWILGGIIPGSLWVLYHTLCFGSPFSLPNKFQNPRYVDVAESSTSLWGVIDLLPSAHIIGRLIWGLERGLLWTQPWVLFALLLLVWMLWQNISRNLKTWMAFLGLSFMGVFLMNASFGGWHGGSSAGPRYLIVALPMLSLLVPYGLESLRPSFPARIFQIGLKGGIALGVLMFGLILSTSLLATPHEPLYMSEGRFLWAPRSPTAPLRFLFFLLSLGLCYVLISRKRKQLSHAQ